jgi:hypothetical protein
VSIDDLIAEMGYQISDQNAITRRMDRVSEALIAMDSFLAHSGVSIKRLDASMDISDGIKQQSAQVVASMTILKDLLQNLK